MYHYLLWGDIQDILEKSKDEKTPNSFLDAYAKASQNMQKSAEELVYPDFYSWDCSNVEDLFELFRQIPVASDTAGNTPVQWQSGESRYTLLFSHETFQICPLLRYENIFYNIDCFSILYVLSGHARMTVGEECFSLEAGNLYIVAPNVSYCFSGEKDCVALNLMIWKRSFSEVCRKILKCNNILTDYYSQFLDEGTIHLLFFHLPNHISTYSIIRNMLSEYYHSREYSSEICTSLIECLLIHAVREGNRSVREKKNSREHGLYIPDVLQYIHEHFSSVTLEQLAAAFGYTPGYLSRQLKLATGKSFQSLVSEERIREAKFLLQYTDLSMEEISFRLGYVSLVSFSRRFSKDMSVPPSVFRQNITNSEPRQQL